VVELFILHESRDNLQYMWGHRGRMWGYLKARNMGGGTGGMGLVRSHCSARTSATEQTWACAQSHHQTNRWRWPKVYLLLCCVGTNKAALRFSSEMWTPRLNYLIVPA